MADEYIRKVDAADWLKQYGQDVLHRKYKFSLMYIWKNIMDLPSADVVPVRHGTWIDMGRHGDWQWETDGRGNCWHLWKCNRCDGKVKIKTDFCPHCGAKMEE